MELLSGIQEIFINLLLALTQASFILSLCVSPCQRDYTRDGNMRQNLIGLNLNITNLETLRTWLSYFQRQSSDSKIESFYTTATQKEIDCFKAVGFCAHCNTVFEAMGCFYHYCPCQEARPSLTEEDIERGNKKWEMDQMWKQDIKGKGYDVVEMWEMWRGNFYKTTTCVKEHLRESFLYKRPVRERDCWNK